MIINWSHYLNARGGSDNIRVLIDTNILILREDDRVIAENLASLIRVMSENQIPYLIHPLSLKELDADRDNRRRSIMRSKLQSYSLLESPPDPVLDTTFQDALLDDDNALEVDDHLLYAIFGDAIDYLITEDKGIHKKARKLEIQDRVLTISEANSFVQDTYSKVSVRSPPAIYEGPVYNLDASDPFFDSLKDKYDDFEDWFIRIKREGRKCWVHKCDDDSIGALLIFKEENEIIPSNPSLPKRRRMKLCTFKVAPSQWGQKLGELFIWLAVNFCINREIDEMYLTHFAEEPDRLVDLIAEFGFRYKADTKIGEELFIKRLVVNKDELIEINPINIVHHYYPTFYDGVDVKKFLIPIKPEYHERLFTDFQGRQTRILEFNGGFIVEGNTIKKAYLSRSPIKRMKPGSVVLFYRSRDLKAITSIGVVDEVYLGMNDATMVMRLVHKRTVYSKEEIDAIVEKPSLVLLFRHLFHFKKPLTLPEMKRMGISGIPPQTITKISETDYSKIKDVCGIDERYTIH